MFEGLKDMGKLLKQAQEMKANMKKVQKELKKTTLSAEALNGKIKVVINGEMEILSLDISPDCYSDESIRKKLDRHITSVLNEAIKQAKDLAATKLSSVTGGMNIPGITG